MANKTSSYSVLIFEDDSDLVQQWEKEFKLNGIDTQHAPNISIAEEFCRQQQFDIIVSDIFIMGSDGEIMPEGAIKLLSHLRRPIVGDLPEWCANVPVIIVSGSQKYDGYDILEFVKSIGANEAMRKPFLASELVDKSLELIKAK